MIPTKEVMLIGLAALAGFALTMGGWHPVSSSHHGLAGLFNEDYFRDWYRPATWTAVGAGALAAFVVLRRPH